MFFNNFIGKKIYTLSLLICLPLLVSAQSSNWIFGGGMGVMGYSGDLSSTEIFVPTQSHLSYHLFIQRSFSPYLAFQSQFQYSNISGNDHDFPEIGNTYKRSLRFESQLWAWHNEGVVSFTANKKIKPYLKAGMGVVYADAKPDFSLNPFSDLQEAIDMDLSRANKDVTFSLPLSLGCSFSLSETFGIGLEVNVSSATYDYLDGISFTANPGINDWYGSGMLYMYKTLSSNDKDGDGVIDKVDDCPTVKGDVSAKGCPDMDGDGIRDLFDQCPEEAGIVEVGGCPDTDGDGVADRDDLCPDLAGKPYYSGCPEKDTDGDGLSDSEDHCPEVQGPIERLGCPLTDTDKDGLLDEDDDCPYEFGPPLFRGCPDTDGDGIKDEKDLCPNEFGLYDHYGCPVFKDGDEMAFLNQQKLYFQANSVKLDKEIVLDVIAEFMQSNENVHLKIKGLMIDTGNRRADEELAFLRAKACFEYLVQKGIPSSSIEYSTRHNFIDHNDPQNKGVVEFELMIK